ncbi:hypothetical protein GUITHDRAFT_140581 [Guillardia theta CCMP2712]|uniref:Ion transport domain-containing protein n=1 Tax=Guillardia theta (strain CCMP2712) TaxID=905079 RepID=L1J572_GUITC|nr:hypothetical protein GUITHDRAFT_140581 [Guillardia theta CCMP2712]EKX43259.1 hypothetical protein GUITHDRAFT_140581 [Guillardia theta CCMP2712]|eukprot:XP_005830239.1 hypothetical protein GUITHDRAFT_140581 [Guillardia theta CCMP2712]
MKGRNKMLLSAQKQARQRLESSATVGSMTSLEASPQFRSNKLLEVRYKGEVRRAMGWKRRIFGIGPKLLGIPGSRMVHPESLFAQGVALLSALLLIYSAIVTPVIVGFYWHTDCFRSPTLEFDMLVDVFFLLEIAFTFFCGAMVKGRYCDDASTVASSYLRGSFCFDVITSIPVSWVEFFTLRKCEEGGGGSKSSLRVVRVVKPLRLFKLLRVIKAMKILAILDRIESYLNLPPFMFRMLRVFCIVVYVVHMTACTYWLVKELTHSREETDAWFLSLFSEGSGVEAGDLFHQYVLATYFINTIFSTVGFGDVAPDNSEERIFCVFAMYLGTIVFGTLLSEVHEEQGEDTSASPRLLAGKPRPPSHRASLHQLG